MQRLGFDVFPCRGRLGWFGEFWENLYTEELIRRGYDLARRYLMAEASGTAEEIGQRRSMQ